MSLKIGNHNRLRVLKAVDFGVYLDGKEFGEILMPKKYVPEDVMIGDFLEVFVYYDSNDRPIATTEIPLAEVGEFGFLEVKSVSGFGAFLDWGLLKDLLVPFREQKAKMEEGKFYLVFIYSDPKTNRVVATAKIEKYLDKTPHEYEINEKVNLMICQRTDIGYKAIIENRHTGILYFNEVFQPLKIGQKLEGFIKNIREDEKIDLAIHQLGYEKITGISLEIIEKLQKNDGFLNFNDKSDADLIYKVFGISKKNFKKAIGDLYKNKKIQIEETGIRLL